MSFKIAFFHNAASGHMTLCYKRSTS